MSETGTGPTQVAVEQQRRLPLVWLIPLLAAAIGGWLVYTTFTQEGPEITIRFETATGLEAGKTKIKHKDVEIGLVETVTLSEDLSYIVVTASMSKEVEPHLRQETRFWVVRPRLSASGVSGLSTLVSGASVEMDPGAGAPRRDFVGLEVPPVIRSDVPGREFVLESGRLGSLGAGAPIYFRGIEVGEVMGYELREDARGVRLPIFVRAPHDRLVLDGTVFWNSSGIDVRVDADGVRIHTESLQALLAGGVAFETPLGAVDRPAAAEGTVFRLFEDREQQKDEAISEVIPVLARFDGSVRGLSVGAPVEFRGIRIGTVADIRFESSPDMQAFGIAVQLNIEPQRVRPPDRAAAADPYAVLDSLVARGIRAQLQSGSLLTGQLLVAWDFFPDSPPAEIKRDGPIPEMPTVPSELEQITGSVSQVLAKVSALPLYELIQELRGTVRTVNDLAAAPEIKASLAALDRSLVGVETLVNDLDVQVGPLVDSLKRSSDAARDTVNQATTTLASVDDLVNRGSEARAAMVQALQDLAAAARSIRVLADYLERHPDALIRGKGGELR